MARSTCCWACSSSLSDLHTYLTRPGRFPRLLLAAVTTAPDDLEPEVYLLLFTKPAPQAPWKIPRRLQDYHRQAAAATTPPRPATSPRTIVIRAVATYAVDVPAASGHSRAVVVASNLSVTTVTAKP